MSEKRMRSTVIELLRPIGAFSVENAAHDGCPDVCTVLGWIELKRSEWPAREHSRVAVNLRPAQAIWLRNWRTHGGRAWTLTKIEDTWVLHDGAWSASHLGNVTQPEFRKNALNIWNRTPRSDELISALTFDARKISNDKVSYLCQQCGEQCIRKIKKLCTACGTS